MNIIEQFLTDFKNEYLSNNFWYGNNVYLSCINDMFAYSRDYQLPDCDNIQIKAMLADSTIKDEIMNKYGIVLSYHLHNHIIYRPVKMKKVGNNQWILSYNAPLRIFDENWSWVGDAPAWYVNNSSGYYYPRSFDIDTTNNTLYICCYLAHVVQAFDLITGELKFTIGTWNTPGGVGSGRLYNPIDIKVLSNGNVLVCCFNGYGHKDGSDAARPYGHISEFDSTGGFINTRLQSDTNGNPQMGEVYRPTSITVDEDNDEIFVVYTDRGYIGRFKLSTYEYITTYTTPNEMSNIIVQATPRTCLVNRTTNELIVSNDNPDIIASIDLDTHDLNYYLGRSVQNDRVDQKDIIGGFYSIYDVEFYDSSSFIVCDYGNNCIQIVPVMPYLKVKYNFTIPTGYKVVDDYKNHIRLDVDNKTITYTLDMLHKIKDVLHIPLEKI